MKIVLSIEKDGEKTEVSQLSFGRGEADVDAFISKVFASTSEFRIAQKKHYEGIIADMEKVLERSKDKINSILQGVNQS